MGSDGARFPWKMEGEWNENAAAAVWDNTYLLHRCDRIGGGGIALEGQGAPFLQNQLSALMRPGDEARKKRREEILDHRTEGGKKSKLLEVEENIHRRFRIWEICAVANFNFQNLIFIFLFSHCFQFLSFSLLPSSSSFCCSFVGES